MASLEQRVEDIYKRLEALDLRIGATSELSSTIKSSIDDTEQTRKIELMVRTLYLISFLVIFFGISNLIFLWILAK
jgi:uncharacterized Rmd1/YagE family protein